MAFVKKKRSVIEEKAANPLETSFDNNTTVRAEEAVFTLISNEADSINQYTQALELAKESEEWFQELVTPTLEDMCRNSKKNIARLYSKAKQFPHCQKDMEAGEEEEAEVKDEKESVTEAIEPNKKYDGGKVNDIISNFTVDLEYGTEAYEQLAELQQIIDFDRDYTAEELDERLARFEIDPVILEQIEAAISALPDAQQERVEEFTNDINDDIRTLEMILENEELMTFAASNRLRSLIDGLKKIQYNGESNVSWLISDQGDPKKTMIA